MRADPPFATLAPNGAQQMLSSIPAVALRDRAHASADVAKQGGTIGRTVKVIGGAFD